MSNPFDFIDIPNISAKPRKQALTSIIDKGLDYFSTAQLLENYGQYIDIVKLGFGTARLFEKSELLRKVELLTHADIIVCPGGTLFEIAYHQNKSHQYLEECINLGFNAIEISDGVQPIDLDIRIELIRQAKKLNLIALVEIGRKDEQQDNLLTIEQRITEAKCLLQAGADKIVLEARESGNVGIFAQSTDIKIKEFELLINSLDPQNLIFEAPFKHQQAWLIKQLGSQANLGNIAVADVLSLACLRYQLRADTINF